MLDTQDPLYGRVIYERAYWFDLLIDWILWPFLMAELLVTFVWFMFFELLLRDFFREPDARPPRELIDDAFVVLEKELKPHGFAREGKKRQLIRHRDGKTSRVGYSANKYNERGVRAEFTIWFSKTAASEPVNVPWRSNVVVLADESTGELEIHGNVRSIRLWPTETKFDLYPRFRRSARIRQAAQMVENLVLPWLDSDRI